MLRRSSGKTGKRGDVQIIYYCRLVAGQVRLLII